MNALAPFLLFLAVLLSAVGPVRATEPGDLDDAARARAVAAMSLPGFERRLRAQIAAIDARSAGLRHQAEDAPPVAPSREAEAPASVAAVAR